MNRPLSRRTALKAAVAVGAMPKTVRAADPPPKRPPVEVYAGRQSYGPNEEVQLHVSAAVPFDVAVHRVGAKREVVWEATRRAEQHPIPKDASSHGCKWPVGVAFNTGGRAVSGYYEVTLTPTEGADRTPGRAFFVIRPNGPGEHSKILLQLATNTYNAYTNWAGYSLYSYNGRHKVQGRRVSFERPQHSQFGQWEAHFVRWAESNGYPLDFCTNLDLEQRPELLKHYKLVLSVGHDEYWSAPMRDNLETFIGGGGNVAFFSGNTCCWQVRSEDDGRALACWKQNFGDDPIYKTDSHKTLTSLWSHYLVGRPENTLTGVGFLWGGYHRSHGQFMDGSGAYTLHRPNHWLFAGTNLKRGETFGANLPHYKTVGYECDGCELAWKDGLPFPTHADGTPKDFEVLATSPAKWHPDDCEWYERWQKGRVGHAVLGTYTRGGTVVTVGSTDWSHGLRGGDANVVRITKNVLDKLGK